MAHVGHEFGFHADRFQRGIERGLARFFTLGSAFCARGVPRLG